MPDPVPLDPADRLAIVELSNPLGRAVDAKDWAAARALFADEIVTDLPGAERRTGPADDLVGMWAASLFAEKTSFHLRGGHVVRIDRPDAAAVDPKAYAWNRLTGAEGGDLWEVWGDCASDVTRRGGGCVITRFAFQPSLDRGNAAVPGMARSD